MMNATKILIASWMAFLIFTLNSGCSPAPRKPTDQASDVRATQDKVVLLLNWYPESEHGGFYAALVHGIYAKHGLDVEIRPGGRSIVVANDLALGRVQFGVGNADDVLVSRSQKAPVVALMAPLQDGPRCIMVREDSGITRFEELKNITLQIDPSRPYVPFLQSKGLLDKSVQLAPYFGSVAQLVAGPGFAQQAYNFSEPLLAEQAGIKVRNLMMSDIGYNPYCCCLTTTESYMEKEPEIVRRMVKASMEGWQAYLEKPDETNSHILKQNDQGITAEALQYGVKHLKKLCLPDGVTVDRLGEMSADRWSELANQLKALKLIDSEVDSNRCFTLKYLAASEGN